MMSRLDRVRGSGCNIVGDRVVTVIEITHGDPLLAGFVKLHRAEDRLIKSKIVDISPLLRSEGIKDNV